MEDFLNADWTLDQILAIKDRLIHKFRLARLYTSDGDNFMQEMVVVYNHLSSKDRAVCRHKDGTFSDESWDDVFMFSSGGPVA